MTEAKKILIGPSTFGAVDGSATERLRSAGFDPIPNPFGRKLTKTELTALLPGVLGLVAGLEPLTRDVLEQSQLKVISRVGVGLSNIDLEAARDLKIKVRSTPDAPTVAVAELTVGAMINLMRRISEMDRDLHEGRWAKKIGIQLEGKTVLIIGFGRIGRKVASLLQPFNVSLLVADPAVTEKVDGVSVLPLAEALPLANVITLHASGDSEVIGEREFCLIKPGAFILNAGRGGLINENGLCAALDSGIVAGAWIDTFPEEPYAGRLTNYPQVVLTPHIGSASVECRQQMEMQAVENLLAALEGDEEL